MLRWVLSRRPILLLRGLLARRDTPNLNRLAAEMDAEAFVWAILPHAARSFAASIVALPRRKAKVAAVAYLYCRMLDTYEDLFHDPDQRVAELLRFGDRLKSRRPARPTRIDDTLAVDERDRLHLLLVERSDLVDRVFLGLPAADRTAIVGLVENMAHGMAWSTETFTRQGGVLRGRDQVIRYCHNVIGYPALFALWLLDEDEPHGAKERDALRVSEMVQLANITRDVEKDSRRGVAYHSALEPFLNGSGGAEDRIETIRRVREEFLELALGRVDSYVRLFEEATVRRSPAARAAAVMMLSFTDLHYRKCMEQAGHESWRGLGGPFSIVISASPALVSVRAARLAIARIKRRFLAASDRLARQRLTREDAGLK